MKTLSAFILILICLNSLAQNGTIKITFAGKTGGSISKEEFVEGRELEIVSPKTDTTLKVESYMISIAGKGIAYKEFKIKGNLITHEVDSTINKMPTGAKIYIDALRVSKRNRLMTIHPIEFVLTD